MSQLASQLQQSINMVPTPTQQTYDVQRTERQRLIEERRLREQEGRRILWTERQATGHYSFSAQPFEFGKPIGWQGYKWVENIRGNDGDFYALYRPNVGGPNRKLYNIIMEKWEPDRYIRSMTCQSCGNSYDAIRPGLNKCPNCHTERNFQA